MGFLVLQTFEYKAYWKTTTPYSDSYGSIFYAVTGFSAAHVGMGVLILLYVCILPSYGLTRVSPYRPYQVAALFWHFVDIVWIITVVIVYISPNFIVYGH